MKTFINLFFSIFLVSFLIIACQKLDSNLEVQPLGKDLEVNYYSSPEQVFQALVAVYACMSLEREFADKSFSKLAALNAAADEATAGGAAGGSDFPQLQSWSNYKLIPATGPQSNIWEVDWRGIYRANVLLEKLNAGAGGSLSNELKLRYIAEAKFLRAYYYFELVRLFKNIPLITNSLAKSDWYNVAQVKPEAVYTQIEKDLTESITNLPSTLSASEYGRISKGAGMALLGKVILYQNNNTRMLEAASWFEQVASSGMYSLLAKYDSLFSTNYKFNSESILEISFSGTQQSYWGGPMVGGNKYCIMVGARDFGLAGYGSGWSFNPLYKNFVEGIKNDPRYKATVANLDSIATANNVGYTKGHEHTGFFVNKYAPLQKHNSATNGAQGTTELNYPNNIIEIRLADVYLMLAECLVRGGGDVSKAALYLNRVRTRVGLPNTTATLDNIYNERKFELALEGHRWYDLVRTKQAPQVLAFKGFKEGIHECLPIPLTEISNTRLVQNFGY